MKHATNKFREFKKLTGYTAEQIKSVSRKRELVDARQIYWKWRREQGCTLMEIAKETNRTHATVRSGIIRVDDLIALNDKFITELWNKLI